MLIREATPNDSKAVLTLLDQLCEWDKCSKYSDSHFLEALKSDHMKVFVAEEEGQVVGEATIITYLAIRHNKPYVFVDELVVDEDYRGKGIGKALMQRAIEYGKEIDAKCVNVASRKDKTESHEFYKAIGFKLEDYVFRHYL